MNDDKTISRLKENIAEMRAEQPTLTDATNHISCLVLCKDDDIRRLGEELTWPEDERSEPDIELEHRLEGYRLERKCLAVAITKLKEEEYAAKMLDGVHARMELARQMNEQGEL